MMKFERYTDVHQFYNATYDILMRHEAQNLIPLGNIVIGNKGEDKTDWRDPANWFMATVSDEGGIRLTAIMTPPHNMTLYATDNHIDKKVIHFLIDELGDLHVPGVTTERDLAECFAEIYTSRKQLTYKSVMDQRIYELIEVNPDIPKVGNARLLEERDIHYFPYWLEAFIASAEYGNSRMPIPQNLSHYEYLLASNKLYVLEDNGIPVSMAGFSREMQTVVGVAFVYTPSYMRNKGYASSIVAHISQVALDNGFKRCVLYTDLANPTSNSIYQKIGYKPVCDSVMFKFGDN